MICIPKASTERAKFAFVMLSNRETPIPVLAAKRQKDQRRAGSPAAPVCQSHAPSGGDEWPTLTREQSMILPTRLRNGHPAFEPDYKWTVASFRSASWTRRNSRLLISTSPTTELPRITTLTRCRSAELPRTLARRANGTRNTHDLDRREHARPSASMPLSVREQPKKAAGAQIHRFRRPVPLDEGAPGLNPRAEADRLMEKYDPPQAG